MGGLLLPLWGLPEKRIGREDYERIAREVEMKLLTQYPRAEALRTFAMKENFGDLDVICDVNNGEKPLLDFVKREFHPSPHKNGQTISFPYENSFQVDLISVGKENFAVARDYLAWETGCAMGVVANAVGLRFGWDGLHLKYPLNLISPELPAYDFFLVTFEKDPGLIFTLLGFDYFRFQQGFAAKEDLFKWIEDSRYFDPKIFNLDELNSQNRIRNSKRPTYNALVEWVRDKEPKSRPSKSEMRDYIIRNYPHVQSVIGDKSAQIIKNKERAAKFNGNLVKETSGLEGPPLGKLIVEFKNVYSKAQTFEEYLDARSAEEVYKVLKQFCFLRGFHEKKVDDGSNQDRVTA
jgi:hypothetical protein